MLPNLISFCTWLQDRDTQRTPRSAFVPEQRPVSAVRTRPFGGLCRFSYRVGSRASLVDGSAAAKPGCADRPAGLRAWIMRPAMPARERLALVGLPRPRVEAP
jgi:hypothetical protein